MRKKHPTWVLVCCCIASIAVSLAVWTAFLYESYGGRQGVGFAAKINEVRGVIDETYVGEVDWDAIADSASAAMVSAVGDRWSYYMTAGQYAEYENAMKNISSGIGITIVQDSGTGEILISSVSRGSPCERAGVLAGETLLAVAGQEVKGMLPADIAALVRAQEGEFALSLRGEDGTEREVTVKAETYYSNPVTYEMLGDGIGYIKLDNFDGGGEEEGHGSSAQESIKAIEALLGEGMDSLIFDVRGNPGGYLSELIDLLDYILPEGEIYVSVSEDGEEEIFTSDSECMERIPMVVMIDADTYSAAEFFAAALSEYGYATVLGQPSTGKGRSQNTFVLSDGSAVHISTRRYLTPQRRDLSEEGGLVPDIVVENTAGEDTQLLEATKYLS